MGNTAVFTNLAAQWDQLLTTGLSGTVSNAIAANAVLMTSVFALYIIILGCLTMFGRLSMSEWVFSATRAGFIAMLLTAAGFNQFIQQPLMTDIPTWITSSTGGSADTTVAQQFDGLRNTVIARKAAILQQTSGFTYIGERLECGFLTICILIELLVSFFIYEFARGMIGFCVAVAPFVLLFYVFHTTRHITMNLAGQVVSLLILMVMLSTIVQMGLKADNAFLGTLAAGGEVDVQIDALANTFIFCLFGLGVTLMAPSVAMRIGGGFLPSVRSMAHPAMMAMRLGGAAIRPAIPRGRR